MTTIQLPHGKSMDEPWPCTDKGNDDHSPLFSHLIRYHFEAQKERFLPTVTFSGGRAEVSVLWPDAVEHLPSLNDVRSRSLSSSRPEDEQVPFSSDSYSSVDPSTDGYFRSTKWPL